MAILGRLGWHRVKTTVSISNEISHSKQIRGRKWCETYDSTGIVLSNKSNSCFKYKLAFILWTVEPAGKHCSPHRFGHATKGMFRCLNITNSSKQSLQKEWSHGNVRGLVTRSQHITHSQSFSSSDWSPSSLRAMMKSVFYTFEWSRISEMEKE